MQIRCYHCHKPFALGRETVHAALDLLTAEDLSHYNAQCPHCRRVNRVSKDELARAAPDWSESKAEPEAEQETKPE
jgi:phage FluMu protein Com